MSVWMGAQWALLILAIGPALNFLRRWRDSRVMGAYCVVVLFGYIWAVGQHWENCEQLYWRSEAAHRAALLVCYLGMCALGPACVHFGWRFAGKHRLCRDRRIVAALYGAGALFYLIVLSNGWHHLYYRAFFMDGRVYGPAFYAFTAFSYACFACGYVVLRGAKLDRDRSPFLVPLCLLLPVLGNTSEMILRDSSRDIVPACYCATLAISYVVVHRYQPVQLQPIAAKRVLDAMNDPVVVTGAGGEALYCNGAAAGIDPGSIAEGRMERGGKVYQCALRSMEDGGAVAALTDVTEYDEALMEQRRQVAALTEAGRVLGVQRARLMELEPVAAQLAAERRRMEIMARLSADVEEKLGALQQAVERSLEQPTPERIAENRARALDAFAVVRDIVSEYKRR